MSREGNKKIHNIYLLDKSRIQQGLSVGADTSPYEIAAQIMAEGQNYKIQRLKEGLNTTNFSIALYFRKEDYHQNKFASFCATFVALRGCRYVFPVVLHLFCLYGILRRYMLLRQGKASEWLEIFGT